MGDLPAVTFIVLVGQDNDRLVGCLETIARQEYPERLVDTVVVECRRDHDAVEVARRFNAVILHCDQEDLVARINLGIESSKGDIVFAIGADSGLSRTDWIRQMVRPFIERPEVAGAFTQIAEVPTDRAFDRYLCRTNGDPFAWFVHGDIANPRYCRAMYGVAGSGEGYTVHIFPVRRPPLIPADHGVGVRRSAVQGPSAGNGKIAPLVRLIEGGQPVALVPGAGIHHQNVESLGVFVKEYCSRLRGSPDGWPVCAEQHPAHRSLWRRIRKYLFEIYGLTVVMPLFDGVWLSILEKTTCMFWHGPAVIALSWLILIERGRRYAGGPARGGVVIGHSP